MERRSHNLLKLEQKLQPELEMVLIKVEGIALVLEILGGVDTGIIQRKPGIAQLNTMYDRYIFITHY